MNATIFVTDDEPAIRSALVKRLSRRHHRVAAFESGEALLQALDHEVPDLMLLDVKMPGLSGLEALKACRVKAPFALVIMLTAYGTVQDAVEAMKLGAYDFVIKTVDLDGMEQVLDRALELLALRRRMTFQTEQEMDEYGIDHLIADSPVMKSLLAQIREVALNPKSSVLMLGETGTGKEFVARVLHHNGSRASSPFIGVNCTAIPRDLFESELFGYERGAFTGAHQRKLGLLDRAEGGTLFLDEIGDLDLSMQAKLLRVIQERTFRRSRRDHRHHRRFPLDRRDEPRSQKGHCLGRLSGRSLLPSERRRTGAAAAETANGGHFPPDHASVAALREGVRQGLDRDRRRGPWVIGTLSLSR